MRAFPSYLLLRRPGARPARRCASSSAAYRPPTWDERGRAGAIEVPGGTRVLLVEGVGVTRRALAPLLDATVWVPRPAGRPPRRRARAPPTGAHLTAGADGPPARTLR